MDKKGGWGFTSQTNTKLNIDQKVEKKNKNFWDDANENVIVVPDIDAEQEAIQVGEEAIQEQNKMLAGKFEDAEALEKYSGVRKFDYGKAEEENKIGQVNGLAWTSVGGELLTIEAIAVEGKGKTIKSFWQIIKS